MVKRGNGKSRKEGIVSVQSKHYPNKFRLTMIGIYQDGSSKEFTKEVVCGPKVNSVQEFKKHSTKGFRYGFCFVHGLESAMITKVEKL